MGKIKSTLKGNIWLSLLGAFVLGTTAWGLSMRSKAETTINNVRGVQ